MESNAKIFSGTGSQYLAEKIAKKFGEPLGKVNIQRFSDGEIYVEFKESIRGRFVFLIQSTYAPSDNHLTFKISCNFPDTVCTPNIWCGKS